MSVEGTIGRLPNNELCILNPTVYGYFDAVNGEMLYWAPFLGFASNAVMQVLPVPTSPIPPSDPSFPADGMGVSGEVTANDTGGASKFDTVASLLATEPPVLSSIELSCKPIKEAEEGYIVVGDDNSDAAVKVFTNATVRPTDRLIKLTGTVHSENGGMAVYADSGPEPYFDPQGVGGGVSVAGVGTVSYAATLSDTNADGEQSGGFGIMSVSSPTTSDGSWVYLTGQIVDYVGGYYSYAVSPPGWVYVYNIQGLDRTPGIRVWKANSSVSAGNVVDVMAKLDTKDGQRILGIVDTTSPYDYGSVECKVLSTNTSNRTVPVGMNNRDLGGDTIGNNPGVTDGYGLYNIGSYVTVWGIVLEKGTYRFDQYGYYTTPYMRIDDGSGVLSGNCNPSYGGPYGSDGVTVFGTNSYNYSTQVSVGDYVSATGMSSVWKPNGSTDTYRSIWTPNYAVNMTSTPVTRQVLYTGTITGTVKLYDMPNEEVDVQVFCTSGDFTTLTITRGPDGSGSATYTFTDIPRTVLVGGYYNYPTYAVSAKSDGFKTRTYTNIAPGTGAGTTRNIYVVPLRKIYVTASTFSLSACSGQPSTITATVRDSDHNPIEGITVRFKTDRGSFASGSVVRTASAVTLADGTATAALYPVLASGEYGYATVQVTDDSAPLTGDNENDDPYKYDWEPVLNGSYGIYISSPSVSVSLTPTPNKIRRCTDYSTVTARVTYCSGTVAPVGTPVNFTVYSPGVFESGSTSATVNTDADGYATVRVRSNNNAFGTASVYASATVYGVTGNGSTSITIAEFSPKVLASANPNSISGPADSQITFTATNPDGTARVGFPMTIETTAGSFVGYSNPVNLSTGADGKIILTLHLDPAQTATVKATYTDDCLGTLTTETQVVYRQPRWQGVSVNYSCPLVADLVPGDNGANEVAVISYQRLNGSYWYSDGKAYVWKADGSLAWTSKNKDGQDLVIDSSGNNTLSAADIDNKAGEGNPHLELVAPALSKATVAGKSRGQVFAFGYDANALTFKPLAGWPALTYGYDSNKSQRL